MGILNEHKYLIYFSTTDIRFPDECPVCGKKASMTSSILATVKDWTRFHSSYYVTTRMKGSVTISKTIRIPVCNEHYVNLEDHLKFKGILSIIIGFLMAIFLFTTAVIFFYAVDLIILPIQWYLGMFGLAGLIAVGYRNVGATQIEKYVGIEKIDPRAQDIVLKFRNLDYAKKVLHLNPDCAHPLQSSKKL